MTTGNSLGEYMCGILGLISNEKINKTLFEESLNLLKHRGPDNQSSKYYTQGKSQIALGHSRLKIIDLSDKSNQPFESGNYSIVFNGEIYNYKKIRTYLQENENQLFTSLSDTEVILKAYISIGIDETLKRLHGMFAFAIYDGEKNQVILARDRPGIKPLYYYFDNKKNFIFASELKAIKNYKKDLTQDKNSTAEFFYHKYVPENKTIYSDVATVSAGQYVTFDLNKFKLNSKNYWSLSKKNTSNLREKEIIDKTEELLHLSVKEHLESDVPVSFAFSGGLDSSLLVAIAKEYKKDLKCFTVKRSEDDIDWHYSDKISKHLKIERTVIDFQKIDLKNYDKKIFEIYDQPIGCSSIFSTYLLFKEVSKEFKVIISGDGGDEIFGGYTWYRRFLNTKLRNFKQILHSKNDFKRSIRDIKKYHQYSDLEKYKLIMLDRFTKSDIENLLGNTTDVLATDMYSKYVDKINTIKDMMYVDFHTFLRFALLRADLSSMAHSVENRVPFLHHLLVEFIFSLSEKEIYKHGELKYILKKVAERYLPKELIYRPKKGFSAPVLDIFPVKTAKEAIIHIYKKWEEIHK